MEKVSVFVGLDVHKDSIAVAVAEDGRQGEVRSLGNISSAPGVLDKILQRIRSRYASIEIAYEAGPTGYGRERYAAGDSMTYMEASGQAAFAF
ncbi:hypothetical protein [Rhizobium ruizarguesonis]|uniref:hypothetical protein n=1 Tax=Rhizobium ruizarguesonis TaxID=2081791 RepID=UPI003724B9CD